MSTHRNDRGNQENVGAARPMNESYLRLAHAVIRRILVEAGADWSDYIILKRQYESAEIAETQMYAQGFSMTFRMKAAKTPLLKDKSTKTLGTVEAKLADPERGMGFILWVRNGAIQSLEGYSYNETLPETVGRFVLSGGGANMPHCCRTQFEITGDFDPEALIAQLGISADEVWKKGEVSHRLECPYAFSRIVLGQTEATGADIDINQLIRKTTGVLLPSVERLVSWRESMGLHYSLRIRARVEREYPEGMPKLSLAPDAIDFLYRTGTQHEMDILCL